MKKIPYLLLSAVVILLLGCATQRPIIYSDPSFSKYSVLQKNKSAFLISPPIDIRPVVQEFIKGFHGDPSAGEFFLRQALFGCLTGKCNINVYSTDNYSPIRLSLLNFQTFIASDSILSCLSFTDDQYGIAKLTVTSPGTLKQTLTTIGAEYVIIIHNINVTRGTTDGIGFGHTVGRSVPGFGSWTVNGRNDYPFAQMSAQVFVWHAKSRKIIWNGFVSGKCSVSKINERTAKDIAKAFAYDLYKALK